MKVEARCDRSDPAFFSNLYADSLLTYYLAMAQRAARAAQARDWPETPEPELAVLP